MNSAIDPHRRFQRQVALQAGACWILVVLAVLWMWRVPTAVAPIVSAGPSAKIATGATATAINPAIWNINLWRPFTDEAPNTVASAAPMALKLFSIMQQGDGLTAAIDPGNNGGILYVKAGDVCNGFTVVRVEANGVVLRINGQEQRLGLGQ
ncbi:MAG: hypothetical protein AAB263_20185 [Planctomycetota bacterium]